MDLGIVQYVPNQGKEDKPQTCCSFVEVGHFERDCPKRAKWIKMAQVPKN